MSQAHFVLRHPIILQNPICNQVRNKRLFKWGHLELANERSKACAQLFVYYTSCRARKMNCILVTLC